MILDLVTVKFLLSYSTRPLQIFGLVGLAMGAAGAAITGWLAWIRLFEGQDIGGRPLLLFGILLLFTGVQLVTLGLLAELQGPDVPRVAGQADLLRPRGARDARRPGVGASIPRCERGPGSGGRRRPRRRARSGRRGGRRTVLGAGAWAAGRRGLPGRGWWAPSGTAGDELRAEMTASDAGRRDGPVRLAFLGCGFITGVHSRHLRRLREVVTWSYASRDGERAEACRRRYRGACSYDGYAAAIDDPRVEARWSSRCRLGSISIWPCRRWRPAST